MSYGIVICSVCDREVHQDGDKGIRNGWRHCESGAVICIGGQAIYPDSESQIVGRWCGRDRGHASQSPSKAASSIPSSVATAKIHNKYRLCECGSMVIYTKCCGMNQQSVE